MTPWLLCHFCGGLRPPTCDSCDCLETPCLLEVFVVKHSKLSLNGGGHGWYSCNTRGGAHCSKHGSPNGYWRSVLLGSCGLACLFSFRDCFSLESKRSLKDTSFVTWCSWIEAGCQSATVSSYPLPCKAFPGLCKLCGLCSQYGAALPGPVAGNLWGHGRILGWAGIFIKSPLSYLTTDKISFCFVGRIGSPSLPAALWVIKRGRGGARGSADNHRGALEPPSLSYLIISPQDEIWQTKNSPADQLLQLTLSNFSHSVGFAQAPDYHFWSGWLRQLKVEVSYPQPA